MKFLAVITLFLISSMVSGFPRKQKNNDYDRKRVEVGTKHSVKKADDKDMATKHHSSKKDAHKVYKKFGMLAAPSFTFEDASLSQAQGQQSLQPVLVPLSGARFAQNTVASPEMVSSFATAPSPRATMGTEVVGDQSTTQPMTMQAVQPQQVVQQQQPQTVQYEGSPIGTNEDNSALKTETQGAALQDAGATQTQLVESPAGSLGTGSEGIQNLAQPDSGKDMDEMKDLQVYNGPLPESAQSKPRINGVSPQEDIKVVNLGDDEKTASLQDDKSCGGCPPGAKCESGQCLIQEQDAQAAGMTGKGSASNPGTMSDVHNLETQELTSLLKDASTADPAPTTVPGSPTGSPVTAEFSSNGQGKLQDQVQISEEQKIQRRPQTTQFAKPEMTPSSQQLVTSAQQASESAGEQPETAAKQPGTVVQPHFTGEQLKELRDFARMYKMYQFIRKMEERLNDPDCAPICRKKCKRFCPKKCCHGPKVNTNVVSHLMQTAKQMKGTSNKHDKRRTGMEDNGSGGEDSEDEDEKKMDKEAGAGKKHILIRIVKNKESDKPRAHIVH